MLSQFSTRIGSKKIMLYITCCDNLANSARAFYNNNSDVSQEIVKQLKNRQTLIKQQKLIVKPERENVYRDRLFQFFSYDAPERYDMSQTTLRNWWKNIKQKYVTDQQAFIPERYQILGSDLAAAHFTLGQGGKVKFRDDTNWIEPNDYKSLPNTKDPTYFLEALDLTGIPLTYEGIDNICGLVNLKWLSLKNNIYLDDWCIDKFSSEHPKLEYLDVSDCPNVTERGLEALYRMPNLKKLIVTNHYNSMALELTCFLLEDVNPHLECEILLPKKSDNVEKE